MSGTHGYKTTRTTKLQGTLRQKRKDGYFYYRLTVSNGLRKEFTLHTLNYDEAVRMASELDSIWLAPTKEVALAQMNALTIQFDRRFLVLLDAFAIVIAEPQSTLCLGKTLFCCFCKPLGSFFHVS